MDGMYSLNYINRKINKNQNQRNLKVYSAITSNVHGIELETEVEYNFEDESFGNEDDLFLEEFSHEFDTKDALGELETEDFDESTLEESESDEYSHEGLVEVDSEKIRPAMKMMKDQFPNTLHAYSFLDTLLNWKREESEASIHILSPQGDPNLGIVFYILYDKVFAGSVYASNEEAALKLEEALSARKRSHYFQTESSIFTCLNDLAYESLKNISFCLEWQECEQEVLWLPWYVAREINVQVPIELEVRPLRKEHAKQIDYYWSERHPGSEQLITLMIQHNLSCGVFKRDSLISWALVWYYGGIGCLQTVDREKMKGYSQIAIAALTKRMGELQTDVHINIPQRKKNSIHFFKALGFRYAFTSTWIVKNCEKLKWDYY